MCTEPCCLSGKGCINAAGSNDTMGCEVDFQPMRQSKMSLVTVLEGRGDLSCAEAGLTKIFACVMEQREWGIHSFCFTMGITCFTGMGSGARLIYDPYYMTIVKSFLIPVQQRGWVCFCPASKHLFLGTHYM